MSFPPINVESSTPGALAWTQASLKDQDPGGEGQFIELGNAEDTAGFKHLRVLLVWGLGSPSPSSQNLNQYPGLLFACPALGLVLLGKVTCTGAPMFFAWSKFAEGSRVGISEHQTARVRRH